MGVFNRAGKHSDNDSTAIRMKALAEKAVVYAKQLKYDFDYKRESIEELEVILKYYENAVKKVNLSDDEIWELALVFGAYLGEVLLATGLKRAGFRWVEENGVPILKRDEQTSVSPATKVYKRLKNGREDNVVPFFDIALCIARKK